MELTKKASQREIGIDALRILSMFMVVILHVLGQGGVLSASSGRRFWAGWLLEVAAYCAVDLFALISGYVMTKRQIKPQRLLQLWCQVVFYSVLMTMIVNRVVPNQMGMKEILGSFFPVLRGAYWYVSAYFALFLFLPVLNAAVSHLDQQQFSVFLIGMMLFTMGAVVWDPWFKNGYSALWLMLLYLLGAYIKLYVPKNCITISKGLLLYMLCVFITWGWRYGMEMIVYPVTGFTYQPSLLTNYISPTIVAAAVFLLLVFRQIHVKSDRVQRVIYRVGGLAFSVYLIHTNPAVFQYIINDNFIFLTEGSIPYLLCGALLCSATIFVVCIAMDVVREKLFRWLHVNEMCERVAQWGVRKVKTLADHL